jgi:3',5'-nucleoside bisphosphate phosphatase
MDLRQVREPLIQAATELASSRENRNEQVFQLLRTAGMELDYRELREQVGTGMIGRPHIAKLLVEKRIVKSKQEAFDRYLAKGRPFFVQKACLELSPARWK